MNVLIACEYSARVRDAFLAKGHNAWSCDLLPTDGYPMNHYQGNIVDALDYETDGFFYPLEWDLLIAHPPCTYLAVSGLHWNKRQPERAAKTDEALRFIEWLWKLPIKKKCIENPVGCINSRLPFMPKPQYIQPYAFGEDASKKTGLWIEGLPPLEPTKTFPCRWVCCGIVLDDVNHCPICKSSKTPKPRWSNQTNSGQNKLAHSDDRWKLRSTTYQGVADAMAEQWG